MSIPFSHHLHVVRFSEHTFPHFYDKYAGLPQLLDSVDNAQNVPSKQNINVGCDGLQELQSSTSMNDFTAILEEGNTPNKLDNMLVSKDGNVVQQTQSKPEATTVANVNVNNNTSSGSPLSGKKRPAATPQVNQVMKKKVVAKACNKAVNNKGNVAVPTVPTVRRVGNIKTDIQNVTKGNNSTVPKVTSNTTQVTNGAVTIQQQQVPKAVVQKVTAAPVSSTTIATTKASPPAMTVSVAQRPVQVSSSYQTVKTPQLVSANQSKTVKSASTPSSVCTVKTEESFKGVAQAAVNNLILSAGQNAARYEKGDSTFVKPVDTSTAHVAALTSNNWVAACAASISDAPPGTAEAAQAAALAAASDPAAAKAARARRASLTADERARQNRDRNREHARNTRLRKKAYVEELKRTLTELVTARDAAEIERRHEKQRELEVREVRYRVMEEFLKLRARGSESNLLARWVAILEEGFTLTLPKTGYRDMVQSGTVLTRQVSRSSVGGGGATEPISDPTVQVLHGATECFDDASKLAAYLQSLVTAGSVIQSYSCDRKKFMMDGINAMLEWTWTGTGQVGSTFFLLDCFVRKSLMLTY